MEIAVFIMGVATGLIVYRRIIIESIGRYPMTRCDYCKHLREIKELFPKKK